MEPRARSTAFPNLARELVRLRVDVIVARGALTGPSGRRGMRQTTIPIVMFTGWAPGTRSGAGS